MIDFAQMAKEYDDYFHKLIDMLEKIGKALPQFQDYQRIFANHERLLQAISDAYLSVVRFCVDAKVLFKQANAHKTSNRLGMLRFCYTQATSNVHF